ncbi:hypothetical protein DICVIV_02008 [Dictyocaulus viviparus]|uniref:Uncharacterized protein n=1 Tax=Dictyocaulus viviparus TaxID=29172 RepID=A0A0D8Y6K5_DICVI|nr:hypothetical protein DICVIV_02008 [Dictyocaulus viviparus]
MSLSRLGDWLASTTVAGILGTGSVAIDVDILFRRALIFSKLFTKNWGHPKTYKELVKHKKDVMSQRRVGQCIESLKVDMIVEKQQIAEGVRILDGKFRSPHAIMYPKQLPGCLQWAHWRAYLPNIPRKGVCIHLSGTGDHSYIRRELGFARGLLEEGVGSILLQNPFYGDRKPPSQFRSSLENVSDLFVMGAALVSECNYLISWAISEGYGPIALSGVSMGGFMASLAATNVCVPVGVIPCMSWTTAAPTFTEDFEALFLGALRNAINYDQLQRQIEDQEYLKKLSSISDVNWVDEMHERNSANGLGSAYNMMCILMDEFTCLANYPIPIDTSLCTAIVAEHDAYVLRSHGAVDFEEVWPGMRVVEMRRMGHVTAYLYGHHLFREIVTQTLRRME